MKLSRDFARPSTNDYKLSKYKEAKSTYKDWKKAQKSKDSSEDLFISDEELLNIFDSNSSATINFTPENGTVLQWVDENHDLQTLPLTEEQYNLIKAHLEEQKPDSFENIL